MSIDPRKIPTTGADTGPTNPYHEPIDRPGASLTEHVLNEIRELPKRFLPGSRSAVMPALGVIQWTRARFRDEYEEHCLRNECSVEGRKRTHA